MSEVLKRAKMMARIAPTLLSASLYNHDDIDDADTLAKHFTDDVNNMLPLAQILVDALKPENEQEQNDVNALVAPVAAQLLARNYTLFNSEADVVRLLKPSINVLVSFCDKVASEPIFNNMKNPVSRGLIAFAPVTACLTRYAFGKSPASRLTLILDSFARAQDQLLLSLPADIQSDPHMRFGIQDAAAQLFVAHFESKIETMGAQDPQQAFNELLQNWQESLALFNMLITHAAFGDDAPTAMKSKGPQPVRQTVRATRTPPKTIAKSTPKNDIDDDEDDDSESSGGSSSGGGKKPGYNPMSFFAQKGT